MRRINTSSLMLLTLGLGCLLLSASANAESKADPTGTWKWERTRGDNTRHYTMRLKKEGDKIVGTYMSRRNDADNESAIRDAKLDGDKLSFHVDREFNDRKMTIHMHGKVAEDTITGKAEVTFNDTPREFDWVAKRSVGIKEVVGKWNLKIVTPNNGTMEPVVVFTEKDGKLTGAYAGPSVERDTKKNVIKENQLSFEISGERDGNEWMVVYHCRPRGNQMTGTIDYDFGGNVGTVDFTGEREAEKTKRKKTEGDNDISKVKEDN